MKILRVSQEYVELNVFDTEYNSLSNFLKLCEEQSQDKIIPYVVEALDDLEYRIDKFYAELDT